MKSESTEQHRAKSSNDINVGIITLSDSIKTEELDYSGEYIKKEIKSRYNFKKKSLIIDDSDKLKESIEQMIANKIDVIITTGGTGLDSRDITVETVESLFNKKIEGFGEIFRAESYKEIGSAALLTRATAGVYKNTIIFSMPGSLNAVKTALKIIIEELPHYVHHVKK